MAWCHILTETAPPIMSTKKLAATRNAAVVILAIAMMLAGCCDPPASKASTGSESQPVAATVASPPFAATAAAPAGSNPTCETVKSCCVAMAGKPGLESAQPLCQMYWLRGVIDDFADPPKDPKLEELCQMEMIQLQNIWNLYSITDAGAGQPMPAECRWAHPKHGPMPFTPLGPPVRP